MGGGRGGTSSTTISVVQRQLVDWILNMLSCGFKFFVNIFLKNLSISLFYVFNQILSNYMEIGGRQLRT